VRLRIALLFVIAVPHFSQTVLDEAYTALRERRLEEAAQQFERGLKEKPDHLLARKDYAYTLLRLGETQAARDQFGLVYREDPNDWTSALEYAFLCHETQQRAEARRVFDHVRREADAQARETAERAFASVDGQLEAGIRQWMEAARKRPDADSVHEELARLAEERGELELAEKHYAEALRLKPAKRHFLLNLAAVREALGKKVEAHAAWLAAFQSPDVRTSERARERMPGGDPPPEVVEIAKSFAAPAAVTVKSGDLSAIDMGDRSFQLGYLRDALQYYEAAQEANPGNTHVQLRLGWAQHMLGDNRAAYRWFGKARKSDDAGIANEAQQAWRNLRPEQAAVRPTLWIVPMYSTRWQSAFAYGQVKAEFRGGRLPFRPYASLRFAGDSGAANVPMPLSERAITPALGIVTRPWKRMVAWAEGGGNIGNTRGPDARAGVNHAKGFGSLLGAETPGAFYLIESGVNYASRFGNNVMFGTQNRVGYTIGRIQAGWLFGVSTDTRREYWANFVEFGPSVRMRVPGLPSGLVANAEFVRGRNFFNEYNPRKADYWDLRIGLLYAFTY
jgi:tetratricopeptide (TPR) repeat protein